jgi:uncharacterized protein (DUF924 family)
MRLVGNIMDHERILDFWFKEIDQSTWWKKDNDFDLEISTRFSKYHAQATRGECYQWRQSIKGRLAEIIILDQFSRNIFRNQKESFSSDSTALILSQEAIATKQANILSPDERAFLYMPFMHSESAVIHQEAVALFSDPALKHYQDFELQHKKIIDQFQRYPHRNKILGRQSTPEEIVFLKQPDSSF